MRVLITGGLGTIGSPLTAELFWAGHQVTIFDNMEIGSVENLRVYLTDDEISEIKIINKDILDKEQLLLAVSSTDMIFHLAATLGTLNVVAQPTRMLNVNSLGTHFIADIAVSQGIPLVIMSTSMVYGQNPKDVVNETDDLFVGGSLEFGLWWYAISKMADEAYAKGLMLENQKAKILIIRPFNVVAPVQSDKAGFVFPRFFRAALSGDPLLVYGDGQQRRTFTWAPDFAKCLLQLVKQDVWRTTVNIGGVESTSILDLAIKVKHRSKSISQIEMIEPQSLFNGQFVEIAARTPDVALLRDKIGFAPATSIEEMVEHFYRFYRKNLDKKFSGMSRY